MRVIPPSRPAVRIQTKTGEYLYDVDAVPIHAAGKFECISNLPVKQDGVLIVVSQICAIVIGALHPERDDIVFPSTTFTSLSLREAGGRAATRLIRAV